VAEQLADVVDRLYGLPPEEFTAARDAAAKQADGDLRAQIRALRRPTASAALVNRLRREQPELLDQLLELGPALAQAQAARSGEELRALGAQRRELVQAVVETAASGATAAVRTEVEQTLEAALADPAAADAVRSGALVRALAFAGFGGVDVAGAVAAPPRPARAQAAPRPGRGVAAAERAVQEAAAALDDAVGAAEAARRRAEAAAAEQERAEQDRRQAQEAVEQAERRLSQARERLSGAGHRAHDAQAEAARAQAAAERALQRVAEAQAAAEAARERLDRLRRR
jgi:chromosome segregation ATPase